MDNGERAAISLATLRGVTSILVDDAEGRREAIRRGLDVTGTIGILVGASKLGLLEFDSALARLQSPNFYVSSRVIDRARELL